MAVRKAITGLLIAFAAILVPLAAQAQPALDPVRVQLKWRHQFQFAGYYAAIERGFYRAAGLDVRLIEATDAEEPASVVLDGRAEYGIATSDLILLRSQGKPVVALAAIFQHSPYVLVAAKRPGLDHVHDLVGRRVMVEHHSAELLAYFKHEGIRLERMTLLPHAFDVTGLISGAVDAISAYSTDEPFLLQQAGVDHHVFSPRSGGIDFYGDTLFTTEAEIARNPARVAAFVAATLKGWAYALEQPEDIVELIIQRYSQRHSREHLRFEAARTQRLIRHDLVELGYMNPGRWRHIADTYAEFGMMPARFGLDGFLWRRDERPDYTPYLLALAGAIALAGVVALVSLRFYQLNAGLKRQMAERLAAEAGLRDSERRYRLVVETAPFPVLIMRLADGNVRYLNARAAQQLAIDAAVALGVPVVDHFDDPADRDRLVAAVEDRGVVQGLEIGLRTARGDRFWADVSASRLSFEQDDAVLIAFNDATGRKHLEEELRRIANVDALTGISSRRHFLEQAEEEFARARRYGRPLALLIFDIDRFKEINDRHGHSAGDQVLRELCRSAQATLRSNDLFGRLGGEEFAVLLPETAAEGAREAAERLRRTALATPITVDGEPLRATISVGGTVVAPTDDIDGALARADRALYAAKQAGRNAVRFDDSHGAAGG